MSNLGFVQHTADPMRFLKRDKHGDLQGAGILHVDDLVLAYDSEYSLDELLSAFAWGAVKYSPETLRFCGRDLNFCDGGVEVNQRVYVEPTTAGAVSRLRKAGPPELSPSEVAEFKSCSGTLQWLAGICRPDVAAGTSLVQKSAPTLDNLEKIDTLIKYCKDPSRRVRMSSFDLKSDQTIITSFADSSFANAPMST